MYQTTEKPDKYGVFRISFFHFLTFPVSGMPDAARHDPQTIRSANDQQQPGTILFYPLFMIRLYSLFVPLPVVVSVLLSFAEWLRIVYSWKAMRDMIGFPFSC